VKLRLPRIRSRPVPAYCESPPASADSGFDETHERDYNIFNPITRYQPDNPLNPINSVDPTIRSISSIATTRMYRSLHSTGRMDQIARQRRSSDHTMG
jgi:hypothetical protein